jgi:hypothetical protein
MAGVVRVDPVQTHKSDKGTHHKLFGTLIEVLTQLRPKKKSDTVHTSIHGNSTYHGRRSTKISYDEQSCLARGINQSGILFMFSTLGQMSH